MTAPARGLGFRVYGLLESSVRVSGFKKGSFKGSHKSSVKLPQGLLHRLL